MNDVIIYGAGLSGKWYKSLIELTVGEGVVRAFADRNAHIWGMVVDGVKVINPEELKHTDSKIVVALASPSMCDEVRDSLIAEYGLSGERILTLNDVLLHPQLPRISWLQDFSRYVYIQGMRGNVAECGVYRGKFARYINLLFPDRKTYLFDTFEGFDKRDIMSERLIGDENFINGLYNGKITFQNTSVDLVMKKMKFPDNVIIKQGVVPKTFAGVDDEFVYVSLDMDLYEPMLRALEFFYPRMVPGGAIALHDYFHPDLPGVRMAIAEFEASFPGHITKTVVGDGDSIVFIKN